jgi:hypothetical protein
MEQDQELPSAFDELECLLDPVRRGKWSVLVTVTRW